jgi:hypothetical protein
MSLILTPNIPLIRARIRGNVFHRQLAKRQNDHHHVFMVHICQQGLLELVGVLE